MHEPFLEFSQILLSRQQLCRCNPHPSRTIVITAATTVTVGMIGWTLVLGIDNDPRALPTTTTTSSRSYAI